MVINGNPTSILSKYHPLIIEGHGGSTDTRDPSKVADQIVHLLHQHWKNRPPSKPKLLITQGDPLTDTGISAITRMVAFKLGLERCLVCLDEHLDPDHARDADRHNVAYELRYEQLTEVLLLPKEKQQQQQKQQQQDENIMINLDNAITSSIHDKNTRRAAIGKPPLRDYYGQYALLQEVTKGAMYSMCEEGTFAHTISNVSEFSVTSFYTVGLDLQLIHPDDMVAFQELADFATNNSNSNSNNNNMKID